MVTIHILRGSPYGLAPQDEGIHDFRHETILPTRLRWYQPIMTEKKDINPAIGAMLMQAREMLAHEHSLFRSLNLEPLLIGHGKTSFGVDLPAEFAAADGNLHGSLLTIIMDSIFGITVFTALEKMQPIATINLRSNYLQQVTPGQRAICNAACISIENEIAHVEGDIRSEKENALIATASGAFMVGTKSSAKGSRL